MTYYTYILYSNKFDRFYYGQSEDINARLAKHNSGKVVSTAKYMLWVLYAYKQYDTRSAAMKTEKALKNLKSRKRVAEFIKKQFANFGIFKKEFFDIL